MKKDREAIEKCINEYQPRKWKIYKFPLPPPLREGFPTKKDVFVPGEARSWDEQPELRPLSGENGNLSVHVSESEKAREGAATAERLGYKIPFFFLDWELVAADIDPLSGVLCNELAEDWESHKKGSLVMQYCSSLSATPPHKVFLIEEK